MKYFGTDGFRGKANESLTAQHAFQVGSALGYLLKKDHEKPLVLIGKDTRLSSSMFEYAMIAGLCANGCHVKQLHVCPTPMVSYLTANSNANGAIMISASHNPYYDNGIKLFNGEGRKMDSQTENLIEQYIEGKLEIILVENEEIGTVTEMDHGLEMYLNHLKEAVNNVDLSPYKIVLDCANGASVATAQEVFESLGAKVIMMHHHPDGININVKSGSTHPESLVQRVLQEKADMGFAFDGDADRCIAVDHKGNMVDGDKTLYACGLHMRTKGELNNDLIVTTVMANLGLFRKFEELNINTEVTAVGDKYVFEGMLTRDGMLGGEQSGHIIFKQYAMTGDGVLTALKLAQVVKETEKSLYDNTKELLIYPQSLKNIRVNDKERALSDEDVRKKMSEIDFRLGKSGRLLVRPSGTEPLIRVMVEAENQELCDLMVDEVIEIIKHKEL